MNTINQQVLTGERALFMSNDLKVINSSFRDGESPLKESKNIEVDNCTFEWKYPLWYCKDIKVKNTVWHEMARAGVWYTNNIVVDSCEIIAPKNFRKCDGLELTNIKFTNAAETLWNCKNIRINKVEAKGDYFAMGCENIEVDGLILDGNYGFDGARNVVIKNSKLLTKDAFWNCENITCYDSYIEGEYLGWNSKNLTFVNCEIESLQGLCYIENLTLVNCKMKNTTLAFEYCSNIDAEVVTNVDSVLNPISGVIRAKAIGELIMDETKIDPSKTKIIVGE